MSSGLTHRPQPIWTNAVLAATLFAVDMTGMGGVNLRARCGPVRDTWLEFLRELLPDICPLRRVPHHIGDGRLLGGLDLAATLRSGSPVAERGLLVQANGGAVVLTGAERASVSLAARIGMALDTQEVCVQRDGVCSRNPTRIGVVLLDEGIDDEKPPAALLDRVAFHLDLDGVHLGEIGGRDFDAETVAAARHRLAHVDITEEVMRALCETSAALGIASVRAPLLAVRTARAAAALAGRSNVTRADAAIAAALVLAPRATIIPQAEAPQDKAETPEPSDERHRDSDSDAQSHDHPLTDVVVEAARAAIPEGLLAHLQSAQARLPRANAGRAGALMASNRRGRPAGIRRGEPRSGARLNVVETLRAAAPWQVLRRNTLRGAKQRRIEIRRADFRITKLEQRSETISIFVVDASGSSALHRLAEAKGAVEQLLADCYIRRDHVALVAFRGSGADIILPPTRSLARAKRSLSGLPGGGGTPLAIAIDAAATLAVTTRRKGQSPVLVLLTDGQANIARDGTPGRDKAAADALDAARAVRAAGIAALVVDISPQPHASAERLAREMGSRYLPLPHADAKSLSRAVQVASAESV